MKWTFPDNLIAGFIRYDLCKTCKTDNNHQRDSCINCRNKREAPEILRDFCRTMMTIVNELLGLSKAYKFPFGAVRNAFYWHFCQRQKAEITHAFNLITHRPRFFLNKPNLIGIVGQFGTGQFSTGQFGTRQFGTKIIKRTIWHQDNKSGQFGTKIIKVDNLAPGQFGTRTIWHRTIWHQDNLAPNS